MEGYNMEGYTIISTEFCNIDAGITLDIDIIKHEETEQLGAYNEYELTLYGTSGGSFIALKNCLDYKQAMMLYNKCIEYIADDENYTRKGLIAIVKGYDYN